jgi:hypothetical protein
MYAQDSEEVDNEWGLRMMSSENLGLSRRRLDAVIAQGLLEFST